MLYRHARAALQMQLTADVGGDDDLRRAGLQGEEFVFTQSLRERGLQNRISAGRAAAEVRIRDRRELIAAAAQQGLHHAGDRLAVLQGARRMKRNSARFAPRRECALVLTGEDFTQVLGQCADTRRLRGIRRIVPKHQTVFLHHRTAAARGHHDRLRARCDVRPPGVDVAAHEIQCFFMCGQVMAQRTATARTACAHQAHAQFVQDASGCGAVVKEYGLLLRHDPAYASKAARISALPKDLSEVLAGEDLSALSARSESRRIAFHSPCTLQHGQAITGVEEALLRRSGYELTPVADAHLCCGSAGTYSILQPALSQRLRENKLLALQAGAPEIIVTANIGCQLHLQSGTRVPVKHWIELLYPRK